MARTRKYYKITVRRYAPYGQVAYDYDEYIWAYSYVGVEKGFRKHHKDSYGTNYINGITEITKEEYYKQSNRIN